MSALELLSCRFLNKDCASLVSSDVNTVLHHSSVISVLLGIVFTKAGVTCNVLEIFNQFMTDTTFNYLDRYAKDVQVTTLQIARLVGLTHATSVKTTCIYGSKAT